MYEYKSEEKSHFYYNKLQCYRYTRTCILYKKANSKYKRSLKPEKDYEKLNEIYLSKYLVKLRFRVRLGLGLG